MLLQSSTGYNSSSQCCLLLMELIIALPVGYFLKWHFQKNMKKQLDNNFILAVAIGNGIFNFIVWTLFTIVAFLMLPNYELVTEYSIIGVIAGAIIGYAIKKDTDKKLGKK